MCGIFGYIGVKDPLETCLVGLEQLEYRGYDSTGIAGILNGKISFCKKSGKLSNLKKSLQLEKLELAIGHTRWATHGAVNDQNAHPHLDTSGQIAIVHNGIVENYASLREGLLAEGITFHSDTDTEVIAALIAKHYRGDLLDAVEQTLPLLRGLYALAVIHKNHPDQIIASAHECPLAIGIDDQGSESILSSDPNAFLSSPFNVCFLRSGEIAKIEKGAFAIYSNRKQVVRKLERIVGEGKLPSKEGFEHFMLKEIYEQPSSVQRALLGRIDKEEGKVHLEGLPFTQADWNRFDRVWFLGCGTSAHAGAIGTTYIEEWAHLPASWEIASEARYRMGLLTPNTLVVAISQSGETADTLNAIREAKKRGAKVLGICNVTNSTMTREADACIYLKAGPEMSVCSTKAFTSQIAVLAFLALHLTQQRGVQLPRFKQLLEGLAALPNLIEEVLSQAPELEKIAKKYAHYENFFFMGRRYMYTTCLEAALKLKEISYANANGYPAGELKHGPIALISSTFPVIAFCANVETEEKIGSNLMEVKARGAPILAFAPRGMENIASVADDLFWLPPTLDEFAPFTSAVAGQLFAYFVAKAKGREIDQPRNLAKSVTVE